MRTHSKIKSPNLIRRLKCNGICNNDVITKKKKVQLKRRGPIGHVDMSPHCAGVFDCEFMISASVRNAVFCFSF